MARMLGLASAAALIAVAALAPGALAADPLDATVTHDLTFAGAQLKRTLNEVPTGSYPHETAGDGTWVTRPAGWWISGFLPGSLWLMYDATGDSTWRTAAAARQAGIESQKTNTTQHDLGFMLYDSYGQGYRLTGDDSYRQVLLTAANSLSSRYSSTVGAVRSFDNTSSDSATDFKVIVDTMMNLELLDWASKTGGSGSYRTQSLQHALTTAAQHVRPDGSTYQLVVFDSSTGAVKTKDTMQGYSASSTWSRGQAWAIYGYTMAYRELGDPRLLETARKTADYWISHIPSDYVPYWDFQAPGIPNEPRDSSAAAIVASGLIELSQLEPDRVRGQHYLDVARSTLSSLSSSAYLAEGTSARSILLHGTSNKPAGDYDTGLIYGDYYFLEALLRYRALSQSATPIAAERVPDYNKDGFGDVAVGAPGENLGTATDAGQVTVFAGTATGLKKTAPLTLTQSQVAGSSEQGDRFGAAVASGDFDHDGYSDLIVGAPDETGSTGAGSGQVNVRYGSASGLAGGHSQRFDQGAAGGNTEAGDRFGAAIAVGDFDGDGYADAAVGAPGEDIGSATDAGIVNILYGGPTGLSNSRAQQFSQDMPGGGGSVESGDRFGSSLAAGRFDAGPRSDLAIGAPGEDSGSTTDAGYIDVVYGTTGGLTRNRARQLSQSSLGGGVTAGDQLGSALAAGDFDGDGEADLAASAPGENYSSAPDAGAVNVLYGSAAGGLTTTRAQQLSQSQAGGTRETGDGFGSALAAAQLDGDGRADLAAGTPDEDAGSLADAGELNVLYGTPAGLGTRGRAFAQSSAAGNSEAGDRFGAALTGANPNGDGYEDIAVGAPGEDGSAQDMGIANLLYGSAQGLTSSGAQQFGQPDAETADGFGGALR